MKYGHYSRNGNRYFVMGKLGYLSDLAEISESLKSGP